MDELTVCHIQSDSDFFTVWSAMELQIEASYCHYLPIASRDVLHYTVSLNSCQSQSVVKLKHVVCRERPSVLFFPLYFKAKMSYRSDKNATTAASALFS